MSDRLEEIAERERKATRGPWAVTRCLDNGFPIDVRAPSPYDCAKLFDVRGFGYFSGKGHGALGLSTVEAGDCMNANADFIAHAREDIPWLLSELSFARATIAALKEEVRRLPLWMMSQSYATGHGDTMDDMLKELEWQIADRIARARALHKGEGTNE